MLSPPNVRRCASVHRALWLRQEQERGCLMTNLLLWLYIANSVLLINHEIDSAYWKEWELFKLPGGVTGFLLLHIPLLFVIFLGVILISRHSWWGSLFSLVLCFGGFLAFGIHFYFLRKGRAEFNTVISKSILITILVVSITQLVVTMYGMRE